MSTGVQSQDIAPVALLTELARLIVNKPELLRVEHQESDESLRIRVAAHPDDQELLTGRTLRSLHTVVAACSQTHGYTLEALTVVPLL